VNKTPITLGQSTLKLVYCIMVCVTISRPYLHLEIDYDSWAERRDLECKHDMRTCPHILNPKPSCQKTCPHVFKFLCFTTCLHVPMFSRPRPLEEGKFYKALCNCPSIHHVLHNVFGLWKNQNLHLDVNPWGIQASVFPSPSLHDYIIGISWSSVLRRMH
jgi:hypothetical protein